MWAYTHRGDRETMTRLLVGVFALALHLVVPARARAQLNIAGVLGSMQYDAAGDKRYFTYGLQVRYFVSPIVRVGFIGNTSHIGDPPLREWWTLPGTDERIWRGAAFLELATRPYHKSSLSLRGMLGVFHSSGVNVRPPPPNDPTYGVTDTPAGATYGGGVGLEVGPYGRLRIMVQFNAWFDHAYGPGAATDPELVAGVGLDL